MHSALRRPFWSAIGATGPCERIALMRIPLLSAVCIASAALVTVGVGQAPAVDTYWQRKSGIRFFDELKPFRKPDKVVERKAGQLNDLFHDLRTMMRIAADPDQKDVSYDKTGRLVCKDKKWAAAYERVKANSGSDAGGPCLHGAITDMHPQASS